MTSYLQTKSTESLPVEVNNLHQNTEGTKSRRGAMPTREQRKELHYWIVNNAVNEVFFSGRFVSRPVYIDLEGELKAELAEKLGSTEDEVEQEVGLAVAESLSLDSSNIYKWHLGNLKDWKWDTESPPFSALLLSFSIAAENMHAGSEFSQNNFYGRLAEILDIPGFRDALSFSGKHTEIFWLRLNDWLQKKDFSYGRPTAKQVTHWRYVSFALSQALVREADRTSFHKLFAKYGLSKDDHITEAEIEPYLHDWMQSNIPSSFLKRIWSEGHLRERVIAAAIQELEAWDGLLHGAAGSGFGSKRLFWVVSVKKFPKTKVSMYLCASFSDGCDKSLSIPAKPNSDTERAFQQISGKSPFTFTDLPGIDASFVGPPEYVNRGAVMFGNIDLSGAGSIQYSRRPRPIVPLIKLDSGHYYREASQVVMHDEYKVLCHDKWRKAVNDYLDIYSREGFSIVDGVDRGLPPGWCLFEGVEIVSIPEEEVKQDLQDLVPLKRGAAFYTSGGLELARDFWHSDAPPEVFSTEGCDSLGMRVVQQVLGKDRVLYATKDSAKNPSFLREVTPPIKNMNLTVMAFINRSKKISKDFSFRNADLPKPHIKRECQRLSYEPITGSTNHGWLSAIPYDTKEPAPHALMGLLSNWDVVPAEIISFSEFQQLPFVASADFASEWIEQEIHYGDESTKELVETCISLGYHIWSVPSGVRAKTPEAIFTCSACGASVLYKRKKKGKRKHTSNLSRPHSAGRVSSVVVDRKEYPVSTDTVLDAICYQGFGSWSLLQKWVSLLVNEPWEILGRVKEFADLGHIDVALNVDTLRPATWSCSPPVFVIADEGMGYLAGFRSESLIETVSALLAELGATYDGVVSATSPALHRWFFSPSLVDAIESKLSGVIAKNGQGVQVVREAALKILGQLPCLDNMLAGLVSVAPPLTELKRFDEISTRWVDHTGPVLPGAYRVEGFSRKYLYVDDGGMAKQGGYEIVKIAAARKKGVRLHDYDSGQRAFISVLGCEPPGLYRRVLVACSGQLPKILDGNLVYENVSPAVGLGLLKKLYL